MLERLATSWNTYRGRAIEPIVVNAIERRLPDPRLPEARHVGAYWTRNGSTEVDLVGGDTKPVAKTIAFVGSVKWRASSPFTRADADVLAVQRSAVPGAGQESLLVGVSRNGFEASSGLDVKLGPEDLLGALGP